MCSHLIRRMVIIAFVLGWLVVPLSMSSRAGASDSERTISAAAVVIKSTPTPGRFSLPEAPGYPPADCISSDGGTTVRLNAILGYVTVTSTGFFAPQKVKVTESIYQRLANGSYAKVLKAIRPPQSCSPLAFQVLCR